MDEVIATYKHIFVPTKESNENERPILQLKNYTYFSKETNVYVKHLKDSQSIVSSMYTEDLGTIRMDPERISYFYERHYAHNEWVLVNTVDVDDSTFLKLFNRVSRLINLLLCVWIHLGCPPVEPVILDSKKLLELKALGTEQGRVMKRTALIRDELFAIC